MQYQPPANLVLAGREKVAAVANKGLCYILKTAGYRRNKFAYPQ